MHHNSSSHPRTTNCDGRFSWEWVGGFRRVECQLAHDTKFGESLQYVCWISFSMSHVLNNFSVTYKSNLVEKFAHKNLMHVCGNGIIKLWRRILYFLIKIQVTRRDADGGFFSSHFYALLKHLFAFAGMLLEGTSLSLCTKRIIPGVGNLILHRRWIEKLSNWNLWTFHLVQCCEGSQCTFFISSLGGRGRAKSFIWVERCRHGLSWTTM